MERVVQPALWRRGKLYFLDFFGDRFEQYFRFQPRHHLPDTDMNSVPKPDMADWPAFQIEFFRVRPSPRVAIGGGEEVNVVRESLNGVPYLQKGQRVGFTLKQGVNGNWAQDVIRLR